jgi:hypothetical protein
MVGSIVKSKSFLCVRNASAIPDKWTKNDRVLEPFALMNSNEFYRTFITFQAQLVFFQTGAIRVSLPGEPFDKSGHA